MAKSTGTGKVPDKKALRRIKTQLGNAATFVRSREKTQAISRVTFNELISGAIKELVGDDSANLRITEKRYAGGTEVDISLKRARVHGRVIFTQLDRVDALENTISKTIEAVRKIDPQALANALSKQASDDAAR